MTFSSLRSFIAGMCLLQARSLRVTVERYRTTPWREAIRVYGSESVPKCDIYTGDPNAPTFMLIKTGTGRWKLAGHCHNQLRQMIRDHYTFVTSDPDATCREVIGGFPLPSSSTAEQAIRMVCDYSQATVLNGEVEYLSSPRGTPLVKDSAPEKRTSDVEDSMVSLSPDLCGIMYGNPPQLYMGLYRPPVGDWIGAFRCKNEATGEPEITYTNTSVRSEMTCIDFLKSQVPKGASFLKALTNACASRFMIPQEMIVRVPPEPLREAMSRGVSSVTPTPPATPASKNSGKVGGSSTFACPLNPAIGSVDILLSSMPGPIISRPLPMSDEASSLSGVVNPQPTPETEKTTYPPPTSATTQKTITVHFSTSTTATIPTKLPTTPVEVAVKAHNAEEGDTGEVKMTEEDEITKMDPSVVVGQAVDPLLNSTRYSSKSSARTPFIVTSGALVIAMIATLHMV